jgi:hypothetical protein
MTLFDSLFRSLARAQTEERIKQERSLLVLTPRQPVIGVPHARRDVEPLELT